MKRKKSKRTGGSFLKKVQSDRTVRLVRERIRKKKSELKKLSRAYKSKLKKVSKRLAKKRR